MALLRTGLGNWACLQPDCCPSELGSPEYVAEFLLQFNIFGNFSPVLKLN